MIRFLVIRQSPRGVLSARPPGESWQPTTRVRFDGVNSSGTYRYGDLAVDVAFRASEPAPVPPPLAVLSWF